MADRAIALIDCNHQLAVSVVGAGIDRVGAIERLQELVAELVDEVGQVDVQGEGGQGGRLGLSVHVHLLQVKEESRACTSLSGIGIPCRVEWKESPRRARSVIARKQKRG